jgi:DNA-binding NarL/FixJ family response regulator
MAVSMRIAVFDPLPIFRRGLMAVLGDTGFEPQTPDELLTWIREEPRPVVLLSLLSTGDWTLLARLRETRADTMVIAVLSDASIQSHIQAILGGAVAAMTRDALPETVRKVFDAAVAGKSLLPIDVVRGLTTGQPSKDEEEWAPSPQEIGWLRELAFGTTVARLAHRAGYSERAMFRLLRDLYVRMGARNRTEALFQAHERGWLSSNSP